MWLSRISDAVSAKICLENRVGLVVASEASVTAVGRVPHSARRRRGAKGCRTSAPLIPLAVRQNLEG